MTESVVREYSGVGIYSKFRSYDTTLEQHSGRCMYHLGMP